MPRMRDPEEIAELYANLKYAYGEDIERLRVARQLMNNELPIPLPELSREEMNVVANLALNGMDNLSRRFASVAPTMYWPNLDPGDEEADKRAVEKPRVVTGWHEANNLMVKDGKRARYFFAYATSPVSIRPDPKTKIPTWHLSSPIDTYVPKTAFDDYLPPYSIVTQTYTYKDLLLLFDRDLVLSVNLPDHWNFDNDYDNYEIEFEVLQYNDEYEYSLILLGHPRTMFSRRGNDYERRGATRLSYAENLVGRCLTVCPGRITLDKPMGHFDGLMGMYQAQGALMALAIHGQRKAVWPTTWLEPFPQNPNEEVEVVTAPDPFRGIPGEVKGGQIKTIQIDPSFRTLEIMDRQEESMRKEAGLPAEFGGMSATNIRTGRRGAQVMSAAIDFTMQEAQNIFARSRKEENKLAIATDKAYFNRRKVFHIESRSYVGSVKYKPSQLFDTDTHVVDFPFAGVDLQNLPIELGQRVAQGTMSRETSMEADPAIRDVPGEIQRIHRQGIQDAAIAGIQTMAANPEGPMQLPHLARLDEKLATGIPLYKAMLELQEEVQREQATPVEDPALAQPGIAQPGQGVEQPEAVPEMDASMSRMNQLLGSMATVQTAQQYRK